MSSWTNYKEGMTIGAKGSEGGQIMKDEKNESSRVTLEYNQGRNGMYGVITFGSPHGMVTCVPKSVADSKVEFEVIKEMIESIDRMSVADEYERGMIGRAFCSMAECDELVKDGKPLKYEWIKGLDEFQLVENNTESVNAPSNQ